ncbi:MAG: RNA 2',3'-cyclic phosphodiesterase [Planctomycetota bacterium]
MAKTRTFVAVEASQEVRQGADRLTGLLAPNTKAVRWVAGGTLHYTLHFLGDITDQEVFDVCSRTQRVAEATAPFSLRSVGAGAFPSTNRPRTLWIGVGRGGDELRALHAATESALDDLGFRGENRRYVPHLTIGKTIRAGSVAAELSPLIEANTHFDAGGTVVDRITVFASELHADGPAYHALARCPLSG